MIIEYHRPKTVEEALELLSREQPVSYALGGGTTLNRGMDGQYAVVDLQELALGSISSKGNQLTVGATARLHELLEYKGLPNDLYKSIEHEGTYNLRQMATIAGTMVTATGRSPLCTALLAMDASLEVMEQGAAANEVRLGDWLPLRAEKKPGQLITNVRLPINLQVAYEYIARSPADQPIVCAAVARWNSGRVRLALGGWGEVPILAMDGPNAEGIEIAGRDAYSHAADEWASAEYRQEMASVLALRCIEQLNVK